MARHLGDTESPRDALSAVPHLSLHEMTHSGSGAICCAGSWGCCDAVTKTIQVKRLEEARSTGADLLLTACPKCEVHLRCTAKGMGELGLEIQDLTGLVAEALRSERATVSTSAKGSKD